MEFLQSASWDEALAAKAANPAALPLAGGTDVMVAMNFDSPRPAALLDLPASLADRFGELAARAAAPVDDVRGTAAYRRHALAVQARRTLHWAWQSYRQGG